MNELLSIAVSNAVAALVLALVAFLVDAVYRRPALVHGLWLLVLLKLVTPPLFHIPIDWPRATETVPVVEDEQPASVPTPPEEPTFVVLPPASEVEPPAIEPFPAADPIPDPPTGAPPAATYWPQVLSILWIGGSLVWFVLALTRLVRFRRLLRFACPASAALQERCRHLAQSLGLKLYPRIELLPGRIAPMLWGIGGSPRLFVPADLLNVLSDEQLDTLLAHELAHLRRRDHWVRVLEFVVMGLYWWHPVVWYARRELREAEEQCCDAWVVSTLQDAGRTYASALLDTLDFLSTTPAAMPPLASGLGQVVDLKRRLSMIMRGTTPRSLSWPGCLAVLALGLTCLPMLPSLHSQTPSNEELNSSNADVQAAKARLEVAKADLHRQETLLKLKMEGVARAENQLMMAAAAERAYQHTIQLNKLQREIARVARVAALQQIKSEVAKKENYHIEITLPDNESVESNVILQKILNVLPPEKLNGNIVIRSVAVTNTPAVAKPLPPSGKSSEDRISELEKKLEKVLRELHEMRKEMKPQGGPAYLKP